ncbi:hypothetical protein J8273_8290 [Carpediemonas membranifera]|uniref:Uncharacterized protein n=1 Tax=Carpediemonas membranifera TaxID=201153 RepID=A0A8J6E737_9EUKA|nr:hypothetical protein J8273_8290 [Carpediemonas membranifera]|eukprot:KAG9390250.1 hypothetical protein J8273_8290 [Carpediemonas membranifera]
MDVEVVADEFNDRPHINAPYTSNVAVKTGYLASQSPAWHPGNSVSPLGRLHADGPGLPPTAHGAVAGTVSRCLLPLPPRLAVESRVICPVMSSSDEENIDAKVEQIKEMVPNASESAIRRAYRAASREFEGLDEIVSAVTAELLNSPEETHVSTRRSTRRSTRTPRRAVVVESESEFTASESSAAPSPSADDTSEFVSEQSDSDIGVTQPLPEPPAPQEEVSDVDMFHGSDSESESHEWMYRNVPRKAGSRPLDLIYPGSISCASNSAFERGVPVLFCVVGENEQSFMANHMWEREDVHQYVQANTVFIYLTVNTFNLTQFAEIYPELDLLGKECQYPVLGLVNCATGAIAWSHHGFVKRFADTFITTVDPVVQMIKAQSASQSTIGEMTKRPNHALLPLIAALFIIYSSCTASSDGVVGAGDLTSCFNGVIGWMNATQTLDYYISAYVFNQSEIVLNTTTEPDCNLAIMQWPDINAVGEERIDSLLYKIIKRGTIRVKVAYDEHKLVYNPDNAVAPGLGYILIKLIGEMITGRVEHSNVTVDIERVNVANDDELADLIASGEGDVGIGVILKTDDLQAKVNFGCSLLYLTLKTLYSPRYLTTMGVASYPAGQTIDDLNDSRLTVCTSPDLTARALGLWGQATVKTYHRGRIPEVYEAECDVVALASVLVDHEINYGAATTAQLGPELEGRLFGMSYIFPPEPVDTDADSATLKQLWNAGYLQFDWSHAAAVNMYSGFSGSQPAAVNYDATLASYARQAEVDGVLRRVLVDGRLRVAYIPSFQVPGFSMTRTVMDAGLSVTEHYGFEVDMVNNFRTYMFNMMGRRPDTLWVEASSFSDAVALIDNGEADVFISQKTLTAPMAGALSPGVVYMGARMGLSFNNGSWSGIVTGSNYTALNDPAYSFCDFENTSCSEFRAKHFPDAPVTFSADSVTGSVAALDEGKCMFFVCDKLVLDGLALDTEHVSVNPNSIGPPLYIAPGFHHKPTPWPEPTVATTPYTAPYDPVLLQWTAVILSSVAVVFSCLVCVGVTCGWGWLGVKVSRSR